MVQVNSSVTNSLYNIYILHPFETLPINHERAHCHTLKMWFPFCRKRFLYTAVKNNTERKGKQSDDTPQCWVAHEVSSLADTSVY